MTTVFQNIHKNDIEEIMLFATFKVPVATCGDWRQCWTTLVYEILQIIMERLLDLIILDLSSFVPFVR